MTRYLRKPVEVVAEQWNKLGDVMDITKLPELVHLNIQRRFPDERPRLKELGYFISRDASFVVAPGDWLVTSPNGEQTIVRQRVFEAEYALPIKE